GSTIYYKVGASGSWQSRPSGDSFYLDGIDNGSGVIQAYASAANKLLSPTNTSGLYTFVAPTPTNSVAWSTDHRLLQITLGPGGGTIRYTTDGNDPTLSSPVCSNWLTFTTTTTLKAVNWKAGYSSSPVMTWGVSKLSAPLITDAQNLYQAE